MRILRSIVSSLSCRAYFITAAFTAIFCCASAQTAIIEISNPAPRIGETFRVTLRSIAGSDVKATGSLAINVPLTDTGNVVLGPFRFSIQNIEYVSNTIEVRVAPSLQPIADGVWIRAVRHGGERFLILEQRRSQGSKRSVSDQGVEVSVAGDEEFAAFNESALRSSGIMLLSSNSFSETQTINGVPVRYSITIHRFKVSDAFRKVKVEKKFLDSAPANGVFETAIVN